MHRPCCLLKLCTCYKYWLNTLFLFQLITPPKGADYLLFSERHILSPRMTSYSDSVSELVKSLPLQKLPDLLEILSKVECAVDSNAADILADRWDQFLK